MFTTQLHPEFHQQLLHRSSFHLDFNVPATDVPESRSYLPGIRAERGGRKSEFRRSGAPRRLSPSDREFHDTPLSISKRHEPKKKTHLIVTSQRPLTLPSKNYYTWLIHKARVPRPFRQLQERRDTSQGRSDDGNDGRRHRLNMTNFPSLPLWPLRIESNVREDPAIQRQDPTVERQDPTFQQAIPRRRSWNDGHTLFRKTEGLGMLNLIAALYGCSTVINKFVEDDVPDTPNSLTSLVRFLSAALVFSPVILKVLSKRDPALIRAGVELGLWNFGGAILLSSGGNGSPENNAILLFAFTVFFVPVMEFGTGRQVSKSTWLSSMAALTGMAFLEEENEGWQGLPIPHISGLWSLAGPIMSALHIFRSETLGTRFDPLEVTAVQVATLATLGLGWEWWSFAESGCGPSVLLDQLSTLPWLPLLFSGLACSGVCNWLELRGLREVHASIATLVYTTIPIWGAVFSFFLRGEAPGAPAVLGGALIVITSVSAQRAVLEEKLEQMRRARQERAVLFRRRSSTHERQDDDTRSLSSSSGDTIRMPTELRAEAGETVKTSEVSGPEFEVHAGREGEKKKGLSLSLPTHLPAALLTSQLKFPFYAAQAQRVMAETKVKVASFKAFLLSLTQMPLPPPLAPQAGQAGQAGPGVLAAGTSVGTNGVASNSLHLGPALDNLNGIVSSFDSNVSFLAGAVPHVIADLASKIALLAPSDMATAAAVTLLAALHDVEVGADVAVTGMEAAVGTVECSLEATANAMGLPLNSSGSGVCGTDDVSDLGEVVSVLDASLKIGGRPSGASQGGDQFWTVVVEAAQHVAADVATRCHLAALTSGRDLDLNLLHKCVHSAVFSGPPHAIGSCVRL